MFSVVSWCLLGYFSYMTISPDVFSSWTSIFSKWALVPRWDHIVHFHEHSEGGAVAWR